MVPEDPSPEHLKADDVITRTEVSTEVEQVLSDLYPLLRTVQPADLNMTLNALSTALEGRGEQLGENLETVDAYLKRINPQIPALVEDLRLTAAGLRHLRRRTPRGRPDPRRHDHHHRHPRGQGGSSSTALFTDISSFSDTARTFLDQNGDNLVRLGEVSAAQLRVLVALLHRSSRASLKGIVNVGRAAGRGVPRLRPAHRPGDAAAPAARLRARGQAAVRRRPRSQLPAPAQPALEPVQPGDQAARLQRRHRRAHRQGHLPRAAPQYAGLAYDASPQDAAWLREYLRASGADDSDLGVLLAGPFVGEAQR